MAEEPKRVASARIEDVPASVTIVSLPEPAPGQDPRVEVDLFTDRPRVLVARVKVLPFRPMPEVLFWGGRAFVRMEGCATPSYREAFCVFVPPEVAPCRS